MLNIRGFAIQAIRNIIIQSNEFHGVSFKPGNSNMARFYTVGVSHIWSRNNHSPIHPSEVMETTMAAICKAKIPLIRMQAPGKGRSEGRNANHKKLTNIRSLGDWDVQQNNMNWQLGKSTLMTVDLHWCTKDHSSCRPLTCPRPPCNAYGTCIKPKVVRWLLNLSWRQTTNHQRLPCIMAPCNLLVANLVELPSVLMSATPEWCRLQYPPASPFYSERWNMLKDV